MSREPIYIFVSHSHKDINKVRKIRNYLESLSAEPILFFLKSLDDDDYIVSLIKSEIDARIWFIYCDSENARESKWVKSEIDYVNESGKRNVLTIDLETSFDENGELNEKARRDIYKIYERIKSLQDIFCCYSHKDVTVVRPIINKLSEYGINLWNSDNLKPGIDWFEEINQRIIYTNLFLVFLSEDSKSSFFTQDAIFTAMKNNRKIVPIYIDCDTYEPLQNIMGVMFDSSKMDASITSLLNTLLNILKE